MAPIDSIFRWGEKLGLRDLVVKAGLRPVLKPVVIAIRHPEYSAAGDVYSLTVGPASAQFLIPTVKEYLDLENLEERPIMEDLLSSIRPGDVFYDVGANVGVYSCLVAGVNGTTIVAFEPHPENADRLVENAALNDADITLYRYALMDDDGTAELAITDDALGSAGHTLLTDYHGDPETVTVTERPGDDLIEEEGIPTPTVVKVDVEGAEMSTLRGLGDALESPTCRLVYCEIHEGPLRSQGYSTSDVRQLLADHGFEVTSRTIGRAKGETFLIGEKMD